MMSFQKMINDQTTIKQFQQWAKEFEVNVAGGGRCGWTPLMVIAQKGNLKLAKEVVYKYGYFLVCLGNEKGLTPMHVAAELQDEELSLSFLKFFQSLGDVANFNISTECGYTVLETAHSLGHSKVVRFLIEDCGVEDIYDVGQHNRNKEIN